MLLENEDVRIQEEINLLKSDKGNKDFIDDKESIKNGNIENIEVIKEILTLMKNMSGHQEPLNNDLMVVDNVVEEEKVEEKPLKVVYISIIAIAMAVLLYLILHFTIK